MHARTFPRCARLHRIRRTAEIYRRRWEMSAREAESWNKIATHYADQERRKSREASVAVFAVGVAVGSLLGALVVWFAKAQ